MESHSLLTQVGSWASAAVVQNPPNLRAALPTPSHRFMHHALETPCKRREGPGIEYDSPETNRWLFLDHERDYHDAYQSSRARTYNPDLTYLPPSETCEACFSGVPRSVPWTTVFFSVSAVASVIGRETRAAIGVSFQEGSHNNISQRVPQALVFTPAWRMLELATVMAVMHGLKRLRRIGRTQGPVDVFERIVIMTDCCWVALGMSRARREEMKTCGMGEAARNPEEECLGLLSDYIEQWGLNMGWRNYFRYGADTSAQDLAHAALHGPTRDLFHGW